MNVCFCELRLGKESDMQTYLNISVCKTIQSQQVPFIQAWALFTADKPSYHGTMDVAASFSLEINKERLPLYSSPPSFPFLPEPGPVLACLIRVAGRNEILGRTIFSRVYKYW